ncbi:L-glyceraldehyde 3-phosphate reductase [Leucobacter exalbidus]|uniref:L-glyceraldehyde 3-phosphate reductase n=1 Tax=Leucobacter exalbidus TaxID=662960 RepID=A0A940PW67_9MICO|nr:L-glyceraldehyde 3-phosphate reductase [Leucobacter exalbidus]MBP1326271.1 L-glyceraldehyde 3-phosphate reductase [Leucobacter exalbidus]
MSIQLTPAYAPAADRYERMKYRAVGRHGLKLPEISLGTWHNFGDDTPIARQRELLRHAFDLGIIHFDLANGYGPPAGSTEKNVGRILEEDFASLREELIISTKAGYPFGPGINSTGGNKKYLQSSLDHSLTSLRLDYVDVFYSHRFDPETPLEETADALAEIVKSGKARYIGISSYSAERTTEMTAQLERAGVPLFIHQPSYSMLNRWVEEGEPSLLDVTAQVGSGVIAFSPLAQGLLTNKYLNGVPEGSRATQGKTLRDGMLSDANIERIRSLNAIAERRNQTLAQMALAWVLRDERITSVLVGASKTSQLDDSVQALAAEPFTAAELAEIEEFAQDGNINIWTASSNG